ncbi:hypothetical protein LGK95_15240 [Clostridium algoriphilum]|uniref:HPP family protein n=1 Tax=Clostridium algoriphilum TaxID=198347 RepID=UPI001CF47DBF|nr:HPP family protein [Clostridium algoriphilum]MCB2294853.1 hypothetical protein [Clostridium algoriphilum]
MKKKFIPFAIVLVIIMCIISEYTGEKEIVFPEIAALAIGAWVIEKSAWGNNNFYFWLSPTIAALTGFLITKCFPYSPFLMIATAFILVLLQLKIIGSEVSPSLSAAILPILMHTQSWYYPLSVCLLTGVIAFGKKIIDIYEKDYTVDRYSKIINPQKEINLSKEKLLNFVKLLASVLMVSAIALYFHWNYIIAPPLIVAFVELTKQNGKLYSKTKLIFMLLVVAAFSGVIWLYLIYYLLHWPIWISAGMSIFCLLLIFHFLQFTFPPAAAITLLPIIIPLENLWTYPWQVFIGSAIFLLINLFWFKKLPLFKFSHIKQFNRKME